jgi:hypothetical protein
MMTVCVRDVLKDGELVQDLNTVEMLYVGKVLEQKDSGPTSSGSVGGFC